MSAGTESIPRESALKVAFATSDMKHVDQHFGAAESFAVYALNQEHAALTEVIQFGRQAMNGNEDKLAAKIEALDGCIAVYCQAVGASAINQLQARGVQAVKVSPGAQIADLVESLQDELGHGPGTWVARAIERHRPRDSGRFDDMEQEGWVE
jgi:nitrogen fixation protein NifX